MKRALALLGGLSALAAAGCDGFADGRVARLEQELRELRAQYVQPKPDVGEALTPLRGAIDTLLQRGEVERARWSAVTAEMGRVADLMHGFVDAERRTAVDALRGRIQELETQAKQQAGVQAEERELVIKALEATATKLETFVRQAAQKSSAIGAAPRKSEFDWTALWPFGAALVGIGAVLVVLRPRRRQAEVFCEELPEAIVDAPAPVVEPSVFDVRVGGARGPVPLRVELGATQTGAEARLRQWLGSDPRILKMPAPELEQRGQSVHVRFFVQHGMSLAERSSLVAEVQLRSHAESSNRRSA